MIISEAYAETAAVCGKASRQIHRHVNEQSAWEVCFDSGRLEPMSKTKLLGCVASLVAVVCRVWASLTI